MGGLELDDNYLRRGGTDQLLKTTRIYDLEVSVYSRPIPLNRIQYSRY